VPVSARTRGNIGGAVVVATKLHIPSPRRHQVPRGRLVRALTEAEARRLTLVSASAGSGKTTLLSEWYADPAEKRPFAWLSLDREDNDPVRFWTCVIEALRTVEPGVGEAPCAALQAPGGGGAGTETAVTLLVNELHALGEPLVLVLDDYHEINETSVHDGVEFLLDHMPAQLHLAIASRSDPPLQLARLRVRHELTELRSGDLLFSSDEADQLLNRAHGLALRPDDVARLRTRTEGWAAGLQLAALSLSGRDDASSFIDQFAGNDRQVVDYLAFEVLDRQPEDVQTFLLDTSILDRLSGGLCDAVTGGAGSAVRLEWLQRAGLFTVPLDSRGEWYRYHHLFGELLRHELERTHPERVEELHLRASDWYLDHEMAAEAIHHALAGGDFERAAHLIAGSWSSYFGRGRLTTIAGWLALLPPTAIEHDSRLWLAQAWVSLDRGRLDDADPLIDGPEEASDAILGWQRLLRALHRFKGGDLERARADVLEALDGPNDGSLFWLAVAGCVAGVTAYWLGERAEARAALEPAVGFAQSDGNQTGAAYALGYLALLDADAGEWPAVERRLDEVRAMYRAEPVVREHFGAVAAHLAAAALAERKGSFEDAQDELERATALAARGGGLSERVCAMLRLAEARRRSGDIEAVRALVSEARAAMAECVDSAPLEAQLRVSERLLHLAQIREQRPGATTGEALSTRELAVLRLLPTGLSQREIGERLFVSMNTVKTHLRNVYRKLDAPTRDAAVTRARELGLL
jgi:LuxR family maltose regulon positive regulatory protein